MVAGQLLRSSLFMWLWVVAVVVVWGGGGSALTPACNLYVAHMMDSRPTLCVTAGSSAEIRWEEGPSDWEEGPSVLMGPGGIAACEAGWSVGRW